MKYSPIDLALQQLAPVVAVPLHGTFEPLDKNGYRFLVAGNGTFIEAKRDWIHVIWPDGDQSRAVKPYGMIQPKVTLAFGTIPAWIATRFAMDASSHGNCEMAAWVVWNARTQQLDYRLCEPIAASSVRIAYHAPELAAHESLCIDLHSHGFGPAFFSAQDDQDDAGQVKIAGVVGNVNGKLSWKFRLCVMGITINVPFDAATSETGQPVMEVQA